MPWKVTGPVNERLAFVAAAQEGEETMSELCRRFGISRKTGYALLARYEADGPAALEDRPRAPRTHPNATPDAIARDLLALRARHPTWGPRKLLFYLSQREPLRPWPSASTAGEILCHHGLVIPRRRRRTGLTAADAPPAVAQVPNERWSTDFKGWFLTGDGCRCTPLTITDAATRFIIRCVGLGGATGRAQVQPLYEAAFREFGLPARILNDNGPPFASPGLGGLTRLSVWWLRLGIILDRSRPATPQDNGRHERMHRTLKAETASPPAATLRLQQLRLGEFVEIFNFERPHEALGQATPGSRYRASPRPFPDRLAPLEYPDDWAVRKVKDSGRIKWGGVALHLTNALTGEYVGLAPMAEDGWWEIHFGPLRLAYLDERRVRIIPARGKKK